MIYTIGHSTHSFDQLVAVLKHYQVTQLIDVRSVPRSRHTPQFNNHSLVQTLPKQDIKYQHIAKLGGLRHAHKESTNTGWHNASFRGYADYMQTDDFADGLNQLIELSTLDQVAIMCAEAVPWRCHRSMIGDALLARGFEVLDIYSQTKTQDEKLTSFAKVEGGQVTYPDDVARR